VRRVIGTRWVSLTKCLALIPMGCDEHSVHGIHIMIKLIKLCYTDIIADAAMWVDMLSALILFSVSPTVVPVIDVCGIVDSPFTSKERARPENSAI
jgi:hypothetical protein